ncbi:glycosyltransferase family 2 protein [Chitinilyticum piscinae]|uniref:Glycosyltransferase family 2 protein n=1 Tax=Chitinilyticum piscinae TaxID=2866724 RepID=A0A8J7G3F1_9NEIS|nr:glycosyltransferase family 2 protein [Chitinilyticum piscinae]MBE9610658.1 glycosyltransferase family 2 protein [Chitinilyticum piscinae]
MKVSIIMPAYNAAGTIRASIDSVRAQTHTDWELLVVDDASNDGTADLVRGYQDERIVLLPSAYNQGVAQSRNRALQQASGDAIAFLDADDLWFPDKLAFQLRCMQDEGVNVVYAPYERRSEDGALLGVVLPPAKVRYRDMLRSNWIGNLTGMYRVSALGKVGFQPIHHEDYLMWLEAVRAAGIAHRSGDQVLAVYTVRAQSVSANKLRTVRWQWAIYRRALKLSWVKSVGLMGFYVFHALAKRR